MSSLDDLLKNHRVARKKDICLLFEILKRSVLECENSGVFVRDINAHQLREVEYVLIAPLRLEHDDYKTDPNELYIAGHCANDNRNMDLRIIDMPDSDIVGVVEVRYHEEPWREHHFGDIRIYIPR